MANFDPQILKLVGLHGPVKARNLVKMLTDEFGQHIDRSDINSALYRMRKKGVVSLDTKYQWTLTAPITPLPPVQAGLHFTPEQQAVIDLDPTHHLLIRGQAGSGKTTVLAARAGRIFSATSRGSLLFLTYNTALSAYVKKTFRQQGIHNEIDVKTFHEWSKQCTLSLGAEFSGWVDSSMRAETLTRLIQEATQELKAHRLFDLTSSPYLLKWWGDEIAWLFGQHITRLDEYLAVERTNRGVSVRVTQEDRRFIWFVYELYQEWLEETRQQDYDNPAGLLLRTLEEKSTALPDNLRYDHVMVDEVQDFDKSWLLAIIQVPRVSLSLAGDLAQKIYRRNFTWKSVGIQVLGGRSRRLEASHRTTKQIMDVAEYLLKENDVLSNDDYTIPVKPNKNGDKVMRLIGVNPRDAYEKGYDFIAAKFKRLRSTSVAVVMPFSRQVYPAQQSLTRRGLTAKTARGSSLGTFSGGIVVTTFHQLKGLEFDHVVIMGLHDSQYPGRILENIQEEDHGDEVHLMRRVLYMAMTRAKQSVTLVGSEPFCRFFNDVPLDLFEEIR